MFSFKKWFGFSSEEVKTEDEPTKIKKEKTSKKIKSSAIVKKDEDSVRQMLADYKNQAIKNQAIKMEEDEEDITEQLKNVKVKEEALNDQTKFEKSLVTQDASEGQVINEQGGYSYPVKKMERLRRFIVLGTEGNTYYATEKDRFNDNIDCVKELLKEGFVDEVLNTLVEYSTQGRVNKEDAILAALMNCCLHEDKEIQKKAYKKVSIICSIPTKLFKFIELCQQAIYKSRKEMSDKGQIPERQLKKKRSLNKEPSETTDKSMEPQKKKTKKEKLKEAKSDDPYKVFNTKEARSAGWGRMRRKGIAAFYTDDKKGADRLLYLVTKYKKRNNWSHKQVLGYAHPKIPENDEEKFAKDLVLSYCTRGYGGFQKFLNKSQKPGMSSTQLDSKIISYIKTLEEISKLKLENEGDEEKLLAYLKEYGIRDTAEEHTSAFAFNGFTSQLSKGNKKVAFQIVREHIPTSFLKSAKVWEMMLQDMPMMALLRNLGRMTSFKLFDKPENLKIVKDAFGNVDRLKSARIHPIKILIALKAYEQGKAGPPEPTYSFFFSKNRTENKRPKQENPITWSPHREIISALDKAFYDSFKTPSIGNSFKTGKKFMLALDVSGSMTFQGCFGCEQITPAIAATALSMVTWNIEDSVEMVAFGGHLEKLEDYGLRKDMEMNKAMSIMRRINFGATNCSLPMQHAIEKKLDIDVFIVYTDSDTGHGFQNPSVALKEYREKMNKPDAKLIVMGMTSNGFTIADPEDKKMLDIVGFDTAVPEMISEFVSPTK